MQDSFSAAYVALQKLLAADLDASLNGTTDLSVTATGTVQGTAYAITKTVTIVTTVGAGTGVVLGPFPSNAKGLAHVIVHAGANNMKVYPAGTGTINGGSPGAAVIMPPGTMALIFLNSPTQMFLR